MADLKRKEEKETARQRFEEEKPPDLETKARLQTLAGVRGMKQEATEGYVQEEAKAKGTGGAVARSKQVAFTRKFNSPSESGRIGSSISETLFRLGGVNT